MMRRRIAVVGILALGLGLAGCGTDSDSPSGTNSEQASEALVVWADDTRAPVLKDIAEKFTKEKGVEVKIVTKDFGTMRDDFTKQVPTGNGPDIAVGAHDWTGKFVQNGVVAPLDLGAKADLFQDVAVAAMSYEGKVYGLPYSVENIGLVRNVDLAPQAPATMDEAIAAGQALVAAGTAKYPFLVQTPDPDADPFHMYPLQMSFGAPVFGQNEDGTYNSDDIQIGNAGGIAFAQWLGKMGQDGIFKTTIDGDIAMEAFKNGESPYMVTGPWFTENFKEAGINLAIDPIPSAGGQEAQPFVAVQGFFISAKSKQPLFANEFVAEYLSTKDVQLDLYKAGGRPPALTEAAEDSTVVNDPIIAGFQAVGVNGVPMPNIPQMDAVWADWGTTEAAIINGTGDPATLWVAMAESIKTKVESTE